MKRILLALCLFVFAGLPLCAADAVKQSQKMPRHPRLLMMRGEEKGIMKDVNKDSIWLSIVKNDF